MDAGRTELLEVTGADEGIVLDVSSYLPNGVTVANMSPRLGRQSG